MELDLKTFLSQYGNALKEKVIRLYNPLFNPNNRDAWDNDTELRLSDLKRKPFPAQVNAILALAKGFYTKGKKGLILNGEMGTGKCVAKDTLIHTEGPLVPIQDLFIKYADIEKEVFDGEGYFSPLKKPLAVLSLNSEQRLCLKTVNSFYRQKVKEKLRKVMLSDGSWIVITQSHKLLTPNGWTARLSKGDFVAVPMREIVKQPEPMLISPKLMAYMLAEGNECSKHGGAYICQKSDCTYLRIEQIEDVDYDDWVYDLEVRDTHNFVANHIIAHNTICAIAVAHLMPKANYRVLIMCPGHLVRKWIREIQITIPRCRTINLNGKGLKEMEELRYAGKPTCPEFYIIGKERAKNHYQWKPGIVNLKHLDEIRCPDCGAILDDLKGKRPKCPNCKEPLYQANKNGFRRYAKAEYAKKWLKGVFDLFVADEVHELKGGATAQGQALANFACASERTLALTGTLMGGYSTNLFYLFWRLLTSAMKNRKTPYSAPISFAEKYGIIERTETIRKGSSYNDASIGRSRSPRKTIKEKPGVSPLILTDFLLENTVFMRLSDVSSALPPYNEKVVDVSMTDEQADAYNGLSSDLYDAVRKALQRRDHSLLGALINSLLAHPDGARRGEVVTHPHKDEIIAEAPPVNEHILPKEGELLDILDRELSEGRRCLVCLEHTGTRDLIPDLENRMLERGHVPLILRSNTVSVEKREAWVKNKMSSGQFNIMIANPNLIKTGLDLIEFPTLIFFQTGYSIYTLRQASRRSWRIGQDMPVRVYYLSYGQTMQSTALSLIATKLETALAIDGDLSDKGLACLAEGSNSMLIEMARSLMNGGTTEPVSDTWKSYRKTEIISDSFLGDDASQKETITTEISKGNRSATVTYERVTRGRIYTRKGYAIAYVNGNKFYFQNGKVFYNDALVGEYGQRGMGKLNQKPIQVMKDSKGYVLVELKQETQN